MTNEEAIRVLREQPTHIREYNCVVGETEELADALDLAISALSRDRWVSVEERLPEKNGTCIVYLQAPLNFGDDRNDWCYVAEMYFDKGQSMWEGNNESYNAILNAVDKQDEYFVTHYRPLPEPPKEET